jgi:hypothetical protein
VGFSADRSPASSGLGRPSTVIASKPRRRAVHAGPLGNGNGNGASKKPKADEDAEPKKT